MGGGKLIMRTYRVRRGGRGWLGWLVFAALLAAGAWALLSGRLLPGLTQLSVQPAATLTPRDSAADERVITLNGETWYALQLGAFDSQEAAQASAESYRARGAGGLIWRRDTYRVLAAAYPSRADAQAVQSQLLAQHSVETAVTDIAWPDVTLRLTGQKAQLDALADAYDALPKLTRHLSELSNALDRGEKEPAQVTAALQSEKDTAAALSARLLTLFGDGGHPAVTDLAGLLNEAAAALDAALNISGATRLGAQIKYCQLLCICRMAAHIQGLTP